MFESLDETIKHDQVKETTRRQRVGVGIMVAVLSILLFGGLYFAVRMMG